MVHTVVIVGGGIAGVSVAETLGTISSPDEIKCILITASGLVKSASVVKKYGLTLEMLDVKEKNSNYLFEQYSNIQVILDTVTSIDHINKSVSLQNSRAVILYDSLCLCTGASPSMISNHPLVLYIRDTESVEQFQKKLEDARRIVVVGNGGIATELVHDVSGCEIIWAIKHENICAAFFDSSASEFFLPHICNEKTAHDPTHRTKYTLHSIDGGSSQGAALGPDWAEQFNLKSYSPSTIGNNIHVEYNVQVSHIEDCDETQTGYHVTVHLTNGKSYHTDLIISATGVQPNLQLVNQMDDMKRTNEGVIVDTEMRTSICGIYAAGDVCDASLWNHSELWHQMKLWTQAKQMGCYTALSIYSRMNKNPVIMDFCFELFTHVTKFFGFKVVLLGLYNGQGMNTEDIRILFRCTPGVEYIKLIVYQGRIIGGVLIGDTELEETIENIILNKIDITHIEEHLLDPGIDIDDFFD